MTPRPITGGLQVHFASKPGPRLAAAQVLDKLADLDARQRGCVLPPLAEQDLTWEQRAHEITVRASRIPLVEGEDRRETALACAAHALALVVAVDIAEEMDVSAGGGAA